MKIREKNKKCFFFKLSLYFLKLKFKFGSFSMSEKKEEKSDKKDCYTSCNKKYTSFDPKRLFCKKGCYSDEDNLYIFNIS